MKSVKAAIGCLKKWGMIAGLLCVGTGKTWALSDAAKTGWTLHTAYPTVNVVSMSKNNVYAVGSGSFFSLQKDGNIVTRHNSLTDLSETGQVAHAVYSEEDDVLLIVYGNSGMDIVTPTKTYKMSEIKQKEMVGSKTINHVLFHGGYAYLAADFGVVKVNLKRHEIADVYQFAMEGESETKEVALQTAVVEDRLYVMTDYGLYYAPVADKLLVDASRWTKMEGLPYETQKNKTIAAFDGNLILLKSGGAFYAYHRAEDTEGETAADGVWDRLTTGIQWTHISKESMIISGRATVTNADGTKSSVYSMVRHDHLDTNDKGAFILPKTPYLRIANIPVQPVDAMFDVKRNAFYAAMNGEGLMKIEPVELTEEDIAEGKAAFAIEQFRPNGPMSIQPYKMKFVDGRLFVVTISAWEDGNNPSSADGVVMIYEGGAWKNIRAADIPAAERPFTCTDIGVDPRDKHHFYVTGFNAGGLTEFRNDQFYTRYKASNSEIETFTGTDTYLVTGGVDVDAGGNVYVLQPLVGNVVKILHADGTWTVQNHEALPKNMEVFLGNFGDANGNRWVYGKRWGGLYVYNPTTGNGTLVNKMIDQDEQSFKPGWVRCVAQDKEDPQKLWLGTGSGPVILNNAKNVFSSQRVTRIKVNRNDGSGLADYLLESEDIKFIAVDGANRKWLATAGSGAYLVSADGKELIEHFTSENSPLPSDVVNSIAVNSTTGEVFFCTEEGIASYKGSASEPNEESFEDLHVFPNPVREDYQGDIRITGLMDRSNVKITDVAGNVVYETLSNGGMAVWNGQDRTGKRVGTGVYFAHCYSLKSEKSEVCKILVINK